MKKIILTVLIAVAGTVALLSAEGGVEFSGDVQSLWGAGAPWTDSDTSAGKYTLGTSSITGKVDAYYGNSSAFADGTISYDAISNKTDFALKELWVDYTASFWGVRAGRQKAAWGKADGIDITNVICPSDMSSFAAMTGDDSKLAIDALRLSLTGNQFTLDAWWIPFFTPSALPLQEGNVLRKFAVPETVELPLPALGKTLVLPVSVGKLEKPETAIWNGEYGLKASGYFSAFDVSLYGFYGWEDTPVMGSEVRFGAPADPSNPATALPESVCINGEYKRLIMFGADAAIPVRNVVLRTEAAFFPERYFSAEEQRNEISALAGLDWMPAGWTITAQYFCDAVLGDLKPLEREDNYTHGATLSVSKSLLNETMDASFSGIVNFNEFDSLLNPSVSYSLSDQINLGAGADIFIPGPDKDGKYGAYKELSTIYIKAKYSF